jgi:uncharacterized LabA/DUF88 family protein
MSTLVVADGANVVLSVYRYLRSKGASPDVLREYIRDWFDCDRLIQATVVSPEANVQTFPNQGYVIVHSRNQISALPDTKPESDDERTNEKTARETVVSGSKDALDFWARQGSNPHTSTMVVEVPGAKQGKKEVGVDVSIVLYLFETLDSWNDAVIFANDADFVPAIWSLRRKGKRVYCAAPDTPDMPSTALVMASQHFFPWNLGFLHADFALYRVLRTGGVMDQFVAFPTVQARGPSIQFDGSGAVFLPRVESARMVCSQEELWLATELRKEGFLADTSDMNGHVQFYWGDAKSHTVMQVASSGSFGGATRHAPFVFAGSSWIKYAQFK